MYVLAFDMFPSVDPQHGYWAAMASQSQPGSLLCLYEENHLVSLPGNLDESGSAGALRCLLASVGHIT